MLIWYVYFYIKDEGQPPVAAGFLRCDSPTELQAFLLTLHVNDIAHRVEEELV
jgi:hypothetical protein